jgi:5-methylcytosine-specific restriction endonuclease McrA
MASKARSDIANTAVRIFLQDFGSEYDEARGLEPYKKSAHLATIAEFFGDECCYCGKAFEAGNAPVQDHLVPLNKTGLGLHAWGNIVPSCRDCNSFKQGKPWHEVVAAKAGPKASERYKRIKEFVAKYRYDPPYDLAAATEDLYAESGAVAIALIRTKISRTREASALS